MELHLIKHESSRVSLRFIFLRTEVRNVMWRKLLIEQLVLSTLTSVPQTINNSRDAVSCNISQALPMLTWII